MNGQDCKWVGDPVKALAILEDMKGQGMIPEQGDYLSAIIAWGRKRPMMGEEEVVDAKMLLEYLELTGATPR